MADSISTWGNPVGEDEMYMVVESLEEMFGILNVEVVDNEIHVVAHDECPALSRIQVACSWNNVDFTIESAKREDMDIHVRFTLN